MQDIKENNMIFFLCTYVHNQSHIYVLTTKGLGCGGASEVAWSSVSIIGYRIKKSRLKSNMLPSIQELKLSDD